MGNKRFEFQENNYYHIYNRWFEKQIIFRSDNDFEKFYKYVIRYQKDYKDAIKIAAYCFLPNHFHFVFQVRKTGLQLSDFMRKIQVSYAMYFKRKYQTGLKTPVFDWRFRSKHIENEKYLYHCIAYVSFNPLKHEIVNNISTYKWTSYHQLNIDEIQKYKNLELDELEF